MKDRLNNGHPLTLISTIVGLGIVVASIVLFIFKKLDFTQLMSLAGLGLAIAAIKINKGGIPPASALIIGLGLLVFGCRPSYDACLARYGSMGDTLKVPVTITKEVPVPVVVSPDSCQFKIWLDSLRALAPGDTIYREDANSKLAIKYWKDRYNNLVVQARYKGDTIQKLVYITVHDTVGCPTQIFADQVKTDEAWPWWKWLILLGFLIAIIQIIKLIKN